VAAFVATKGILFMGKYFWVKVRSPKTWLVATPATGGKNDIKDLRISTLQKIVELGFGGRLQLSIHL
jgi:hypothetical protein